jgi:hypothetical protein
LDFKINGKTDAEQTLGLPAIDFLTRDIAMLIPALLRDLGTVLNRSKEFKIS